MGTMLVIGGGLAGLTAANLLADRGHQVRLVERGSLGGRARTSQSHGCLLNLGAHALYRSGHGMRIMASLGIAPDGEVPQARYGTLGGKLVSLPVDGWSTLTSPALSGGRLAFMRMFAGLGSVKTGQSVAQWLDGYGLTGAARCTAEAMVRLTSYANADTEVDAAAAAAQLQLGTKGVLYLHGGWQQLVEALAARARAKGVEIDEHAAAGTVDERDDDVRVEGVEGRWDGVVLAVPPTSAAKLTGVVEQGLVAAAAASLDLVLDTLPNPDVLFALGLDVPYYFSVASAFSEVAPAGKYVVHCMAYLEPGKVVPREALEAWIDGLQPGWRDHMVHARWAPRFEVTGALPTVARARPGVVVSERVVRCGDAYGDRGMLMDAALASAEEAVEHLAGRSAL